VWSEAPRDRIVFGATLTHFLLGLRDIEVLPLHGQSITGIEGLCSQLERVLPGPRLDRRIDGPNGVTSLLRERPSFPGRAASRYRIYIWHDADVLLEADAKLFGRTVDAMAGVGAEAEYVSDEMLLIHRTVFVGSSALAGYWKVGDGQFQSWHDDGMGDPFWEVVTGLPFPPIDIATIDELVR